jgi:predicted ATPase/DNA-binding CsgD family transcriptional regulator
MTGLGLLDSRGLEPVQRITRYLVERQVLLVLDNCEHVLTPVAWLVDAVLRACPRASVLATSREPIGVAGEIAWKVPPLTLPPSPSCEAMRLFVERGGEVRPGFRLDEDTAAAVEAICVRLDGIPLAIELAAARLRSLSPERILEALSDRFRLLTGGARTALPRHQTLQASMAWSHDLLTEAERALFRRLSVFNGGFTLDAAAAVGAGDPLADREVLTLLSNLVDKSLVVFEGERYRLLQTMADFAGTKLVESGEAGTVRDRHAAWMVAWAENISPELERGPRPEVLDRVEADHDNVRAALGWLLERQAHDAGMRLVAALAVFWTARGHYTEGRRWCRRVLEAAPQESSALRGRALWALSHLREWGVALEEGYGIPENQVVLALGEQLADPSLVARALVDQILLAAYATPDVGPALCERALEAARRAGDEHALGMAHWGTAFYWNMARARCDEAAPHLEAVAEHARRTASPYWRGWGQLAAGIGHWYQGRLAEARQALGDAVRCGDELDEPKLELYASVFLSNVMLSQGDYENATRIVEYFGARQLRSLDCAENWPQGRLALIALAHGDHAEAARVFANFGPIYLGYGIPYLSAEHALIRVRIAQADEDLAGARAALREAMAFSDQLANPWLQAEAHHLDGLLHRAEGDPGAAEHAHHQALALCAEYGFRGRAAEVLEELASLAAAGESHAEAVRLLGVAWALREATGEQRSPTAQADFEAESTVLTGALGEATYDALFKEGTALSFDAAMTYASRARGERKRPSSGWAALTPAELAVVALAAAGLSNAEIGHRLFISPATAKTHLAHIYAKLGVANRAALAAQATARSMVK